MSCDASNSNFDDTREFNKAGLDGLNEYIEDLRSQGIEPKVIGKIGGVFGDAYDVAKAGAQVNSGEIKGAVATVSGAFFGGIGAAAGFAVAGFVVPGLGLVGAIVLAGVAGAVIGDLAENVTKWMLDPTLEPKFHEELLRNREQRLREKGIDPDTDPGVANMRRQLDLARERAGMCDQVHDRFDDAVTFAPRDPLALDLDNDGIETVAINPTAPILFDHNGDGAPSATGWLKGDDGWLVNDLDLDGKITSGKELLGVDTDITVGDVTRKATTGFEALRALDTHQDGDGKNLFDSRDAAFSQLRIWQDKNQNGVTDAGELSTLSALGIVSIQLQETTTNVDLGGGNSITGKALVTRRVGTSTSTSEVDSVLVTNDSAANLNLADNPFYTDLPDVALTDTARSLPNMQGSGLVHSLREAMSLGNAKSSALTSTVQAFAAATTRDAQMALLDKLIAEWGATSTLATSGAPVFGTWSAASVAPNPNLSATTQQRITTFAEQNPEMYRKVIVLEQFNGQMGLSTLMNRWNVTLPAAVTNLLNGAYSALRESVYGALTVQTRLKPYLDAINITVDDQGLRFDLTDLSALIASQQSTDITKAITDVLELSQYAGETLFEIGFDSTSTMRSLLSSAPSNLPLLSQLSTLGLFQAGATTGTSKNDMYLGDQGNNSFKAGDGSDLLSGGDGNDTLYGEGSNDTLDGGLGNDNLRGGAGADVYLFGKGDGQDTIYSADTAGAGPSADTIVFRAGISLADVSLTRSNSDLLIRINGSTDVLTVGSYFNADATTGYAIEALRFADGTEWDIPTVKSKVLQSTTGNDTLTGYASHDSISGDAGNDTLYGEAGNDTLDGGGGNDFLFGGAGSDTYLFGKGDGQDTIYAPDAYGKGAIADHILFEPGVVPADVSLKRSGDDLLISINGTADSLLVNFYFGFDVTSGYALESLRFADGTTWDIPTVKAKALLSTAGNDVLTGYASHDSILGGSGNDTLYGDAGNDTLDGGSGNDYLVGGSGSAWDENTGSDVYLFSRGSGQDTISNGSFEATGRSPDTILLGAGITTTDLTLTHLGDDLIIRLGGTSDSLRVVRYFDGDGTTSGMIESIQFTDGTVWTYANVKAMALVPSTGNDRLHGYSANDTVNSGAGNDTVYGYAGNDVLEGGTGIDNLYGGEGDDRIHGDEHSDNLYGDAGADTLSGGAGMDNLSGGNGNDSIQGDEDNDFLLGEDGNDTLGGGGGDDTLRGGQGADVYLFGKGSGQDSLHNEDTDAVGTNPDTILLGTGIGTADINLAKSNNDLIIGINGTSDRLIVNEYFYNDGVSKHVVENLKFASGATWDVKTVLNKFTISTDGADVLYGTPDADAIDGRAGNDTIYAGLGSDTYKFGKGDGRDVIASIDDTAVGKIDTLLFKPGVTPNDVTFGTAPDPFHTYQLGGGDSLVIKIAGSTDQVTIQHFLDNGDPFNTRNPLQAIKFEDGTTWGVQTILSKLYAGTDAADIINGTSKGELITGGAGNDSLDGGSGRDTLHGGSGNDYIDEGSDDGNDTFLFGKGDGQDTISGGQDSEPGEINTLLFKQGVTPSEVTFGTHYSALIVKIAGSTDQIVAHNFLYQGFPANGYAFQQIKFADGTLWKVADILSKLYAGTESADRLEGTSYAEAINGQSGDDSLFGGDGDDTLSGGAGNDSLYGESRNDQLIGGSGDDLMDGGKGNDILIGGAGNDTYIVDALLDKVIESSDEGSDTIQTSVSYAAPDHVERMNATGSSNTTLTANNTGMILLGNTGNNQLIGGTGADRLYSSAGNDTLIGGLGNDLYYISDLNDAIVERANEGADIVFSFVDNIVLASGIETLNMVQGLSAFGNDEANKINGNSGHNVIEGRGGFDNIKGGDGNDVLRGGAHRDNLGGGAGNDTYIMAVGDGVDFIFNEDALGHDVLMFEGVSEQQLWFSQTGIGLNVSVMGQGTGVNIVGWQSGAANQVDEIKVGGTGKTLSASKVANLIQVMSTMVPPAANQTSLSAAQQAQLAPVLAANWV